MHEQPIARRIALILVAIVSVVVVLFGAATTFTFGYSVVGPFMLTDIIGRDSAALLSGAMTLILFDAGWIAGLIAFIWTSDTFLQRSVAGLQLALNLLFSTTASVVSIILLSPMAAYLTPATLTTARYLGVAALLIALVLNILSTIVQILAAPTVANALRVAMQSGAEVDFQRRMEDELDTRSRQQAEQLILREIPTLASQRSNAALLDYYARMGFPRHVIEHDPNEHVGRSPHTDIPLPDLTPADNWTLARLLDRWQLSADDFAAMAAAHNWTTARDAWHGLADLPAGNPCRLPAGLSFEQFAMLVAPAMPQPARFRTAHVNGNGNGSHPVE